MPPPIHAIQPTFAGGEFTPGLYARVDIAKYLTGLRRGRNVNILPQGGVRNRPGNKMVAAAGDSTHQVRLIEFIASNSQAYIIELGHQYARFYTQDAQVLNIGIPYQISTPYSGSDLFNIKFAQSADVLYLAHPSYAPQTLTFNSSINWVLAAYSFINGPFMIQNTDTTSTITPSATTGAIALAASKSIFNAGQVGGLFELLATISGQTITPNITTSVLNWIPTKATWQAVTTGTWSGTILIQTSPDNITWTTVSTVTSNGTVSGTASFTDGYLRAVTQSSLAFSGTATVVLTGNGDATAATNLGVLNSATAAVPAGDTAKITITGIGTQTIALQRSDDVGVTWTTLASYTTNQAGTSVATTKTACLIRALCSAYTGGGPAVVTVDGTTGAAPTLSVAVSTANVSQAIQCGHNWFIITNGTWNGKLRVEISTDGGNNWQLIQALSSGTTNQNFNTSGDTGVAQGLLRVSADQTVAFSGTAVISLTSGSFTWTGIVKITAFSSATSVSATVQNLSNADSTGLANTSATWEWSEGSWSTYRGFPTAVTFYQDRGVWASTLSEPNTVWHTKTSSYADYGISSPFEDSDGFSVVLASRKLNSVNFLVPMSQALVCGSGDMAFGLSPGTSGIYSATSIQQTPMDHRGSYNVDPVVVGNEILLIQQMGTVVRNLIFQLAVNGFMGDNISLISQHLFTGYTIAQMTYQQEPDSIVWAVRSDGKLLSLTYMREQEVSAWTWHDSVGTFESVASIPNTTLGINEVWVVYNLNGTRYICRMVPREASTDPAQQFFVDCGLTYSGAPATVISGLSHLNGQAVSVLADGNVIPGLTVAGGSITLPAAASTVHVGLPYISDVETLKIEAPDQRGTLQGRRVTIPRVTIRFWNSRGGYYGTVRPSDDSTTGLDPIKQRDESDHLNAAIALKTRDYLVVPQGGYSLDAHIIFRQTEPLPFTILAFIPQLVAGEN